MSNRLVILPNTPIRGDKHITLGEENQLSLSEAVTELKKATDIEV